MVILDLDLCQDFDLGFSRLIWFYLAKISKLKVYKTYRFDQELNLMI